MSAESPKKRVKSKEPANFEEAMEKLQSLVDRLESGDVSLEESMEIYEEGQQLAKFCEKRLNTAEQKLKKLSEEAKELLCKMAGITREDARRMILNGVAEQVEHESSAAVNTSVETVRKEAERTARYLIGTVVSRSPTGYGPERAGQPIAVGLIGPAPDGEDRHPEPHRSGPPADGLPAFGGLNKPGKPR